MRAREYISPTQLKIAKEKLDSYYIQYCADNRPERGPQTRAMAVGSAFDAFVKNDLYEKIFGKGSNPEYELGHIFEKQVEAHNRDWAWLAGHYVYRRYLECGALADLLIEIGQSATDPVFEISVTGEIGATVLRGGVPLLGKPDLAFINKQGCTVIHDWKVNGYCAKPNTNKSPLAGYKMCRECSTPFKRTTHKDYVPFIFKGMEINGAAYLEQQEEDWAVQVATYAWLFGESVGSETIASIDQVVCKTGSSPDSYPELRIASHRSRVSEEFQHKTMSEYQDLWDRIQKGLENGHFFTEMSLEDSQAHCLALEQMSKEMYGADVDPNTAWLREVNTPVWKR